MYNLEKVPGLIDQVSKLASAAGTVQSKSLVQYTSATRITPFTLVDRSLLSVPELQDALQIMASIYAAYQVMGIQLTVNSIDGISVIRQLDKLNPNRQMNVGVVGAKAAQMARNYALSRENYQYRLPTGEKLKDLVYPTKLAHENEKNQPDPKKEKFPFNGVNGHDPETGKAVISTELGRNAIETVTQDSNLAVGKLMEVNVTVGGNKFTIPVQVRLNTFTASPKETVDVVANIDPSRSAGEVKALYQAGLISLWDALTGKSASNEWRRAAMKDKTGIMMREQSRRSANKFKAALTGEVSFGDISGIYVISDITAREIEGTIGGKLSNFSVREKLLAKTGVMLLAVMDSQWKRVTIYHHSIDSESTYSFADLKRGGKSNNHDMGAVLEAFRQGQAPSKFF